MTPKLLGCCAKCDREVYDIAQRDSATRQPIRLGAAHEDATRVTFLLLNGTRMDLTFCKPCADGLQPHDYPFLWQRVMCSWVAQSGADHPWPKSQTDNGIMAIAYVQPWKEVA